AGVRISCEQSIEGNSLEQLHSSVRTVHAIYAGNLHPQTAQFAKRVNDWDARCQPSFRFARKGANYCAVAQRVFGLSAIRLLKSFMKLFRKIKSNAPMN